MRPQDTLPIDPHAVARRFEALGLKQWLVAESMGVDRKTVGRWVSGRVRRISKDNLASLSACLQCGPEEIVASGEPMGSRTEQANAARLIDEEDLVGVVSPSDRFGLAEALIRSTLEPGLPLPRKGRLLSALSIACWRQGKYAEGEHYAREAARIGERAGDAHVVERATLSLATVDEQMGRLEEARQGFTRCLRAGVARHRAIAASNLAIVERGLGMLAPSLERQRGAIELWRGMKAPFPESISWWMLGITLVEAGRLSEADAAMDGCEAAARRSGFDKMLVQTPFVRADVLTLRGRTAEAEAMVAAALPSLRALSQFDLVCPEVAVRTARRAGKERLAQERLAWALDAAGPYPLYRAFVLLERARLARVGRRLPEERSAAAEAARLFAALGTVRRVEVPVPEHGGKPPAKPGRRAPVRR